MQEYATNQTKTDRLTVPVGEHFNPEVISFRAQVDLRRPLDGIVLEGAWQMLQLTIDSEVENFIAMHSGRRDEHGKRLVV